MIENRKKNGIKDHDMNDVQTKSSLYFPKKVSKSIPEKHDHFQVKDGFPSRLARYLRNYVFECELQDRYHGGYNIIQFWYDSDPILAQAVDFVEQAFQLHHLKFQQGWFMIYDTVCKGIDVHADPANTNVNVWLTPNFAIQDWNKNGLIIYDKKYPNHWNFKDYQNSQKIHKLLRTQNAKQHHIQYKYRRMTCFESNFFHETNQVHTKHKHNRIGMTLLFS